MTELLPCPFCGAEAERHDIEAREDVDNAGAGYIECGGCGACTQLHFDRKENLVSSWNTRAHFERGAAMSAVKIDQGHYQALIRDHQKLAVMTDILNEIAARDRQNFPPHGGSISSMVAKGLRDYDPTAQPYDEPFRHVDKPSTDNRDAAWLLKKWQSALDAMEDMKRRGDLTKDWGECSLINAREFIRDLNLLIPKAELDECPLCGKTETHSHG
jgi:Lar family restriction alleviation protein